MSRLIQSIKGMPDILPEETYLWQNFETLWRQIMHIYGYDEIRLPILEETDLFKRSIGTVTDIVEKEMFTFIDRNQDSISLRPEGTAGCVRAGLEHGLFYRQTRRLWYMGPMFRHEKPQKGRFRQFNQVGVETFGLTGPDIDVEHILIMQRFLKEFGVLDKVVLEINNLGSIETRTKYKHDLQEYLSKYVENLDPDSQRRLQTNPLRILDSKHESTIAILESAPESLAYLNEEDKKHFDRFRFLLDSLEVRYTVNPRIVRGLDYYNRTVYEWVTKELGSQGTVSAGGRFDDLVTQLGGREKTPAIGFAMGIERILLLKQRLSESKTVSADIYFICVGENAELEALKQAEAIRNDFPYLRVLLNCGGGSFKNQFQRADKSLAKLAFILGEDELASKVVGVKFLREEREQEKISFSSLHSFLGKYFQDKLGRDFRHAYWNLDLVKTIETGGTTLE